MKNKFLKLSKSFTKLNDKEKVEAWKDVCKMFTDLIKDNAEIVNELRKQIDGMAKHIDELEHILAMIKEVRNDK